MMITMGIRLKEAFSIAGLTLILGLAHAEELKAGDSRNTSWGPRNGFTVGPSAAWVHGDPIDNGVATGLDISYFHRIAFPLYFWVSVGTRAWIDNGNIPILPYAETGLSVLVLNTGIGYAAGFNTDNSPTHNINIFVGLNAPIWSPAKGQLFYFEPYYRPTWNLSDSNRTVIHEVGGIVKWCWGWIRK
ncbi:MAG: hypothetical protein GY847_23030 [Proteobacteria bacterium]|nr:hypothetical protein [Pseudomonadota bacterium]